MTTPRDLLITTMDLAASRALERGNLSLALAGAELIDLLGARAVTLAGDHIVPSDRCAVADRMLGEAASSLARQAPYDSVDAWLWRRGRDLSAAYLAVLEAEGRLSRRRQHRWMIFQPTHTVLVDSPERRHAANRYASGEPVLAALATAAGSGGELTEESPSVADEAVATVLAAVQDAVRGLEAERQRRAIDEAAFDNIWRGD
ncbi:GOLPH3/VPS74 family protein [Streptomyces coeruleorubidus]|uniref:GOLPH3/VPS74 family protein n=1 Tax=Streptomyces coeruleorubidus TaxID=116188 RepID=UPI00369B46F9